MTKKDYDILMEIINFTRAGKVEAGMIMGFVRRNIDEKFHICLQCPSQVKLGHRRVMNWYNINKDWISEGKECSRCGDIFQAATKRNKICNKCK